MDIAARDGSKVVYRQLNSFLGPILTLGGETTFNPFVCASQDGSILHVCSMAMVRGSFNIVREENGIWSVLDPVYVCDRFENQSHYNAHHDMYGCLHMAVGIAPEMLA